MSTRDARGDYVAETDRRAREEPETSTMSFFRALSRALQATEGSPAQTLEAGDGRAQRLGAISYDDVPSPSRRSRRG
jgi:hypothetical protein